MGKKFRQLQTPMFQIIKYNSKHKLKLSQFMEGLQDYLVSIDTYRRLSRPKKYGQRYAANLLKEIKKHRGVILLAKEDTQFIGCVAGITHNLSVGEMLGHKRKHLIGRVLELYVDPEFRRKKVGVRLMTEIEKYFISKKCDLMSVEVYAPNKSAYRFYQKMGLKENAIDLVKTLH